MVFQDLKLLSFDDLDLYRKYYALSDTEPADAAPNSRYAWDPGYDYRYTLTGDLMTVVSDGGVFTRPHFSMPLGTFTDDGLDAVFCEMKEIFEKEGWPLCMMFVDEHHKELFNAVARRNNHFIEWDYNDDLSDYLYDADKLRQLRGKKYRSKRNFVNRFIRNFPYAEYKPVSEEMKDQALELVIEWADDKDADVLNLRDSDYLAIKKLFDNIDILNVKGGAIYIGQKLMAFSLGSLVHGDRAIIHFEKADPNIEGLYAVINQWTMQEAFPEAKEVNREEDMGIEGLRLAKQSYHPSRMIRKMRAHFFPM